MNRPEGTTRSPSSLTTLNVSALTGNVTYIAINNSDEKPSDFKQNRQAQCEITHNEALSRLQVDASESRQILQRVAILAYQTHKTHCLVHGLAQNNEICCQALMAKISTVLCKPGFGGTTKSNTTASPER